MNASRHNNLLFSTKHLRRLMMILLVRFIRPFQLRVIGLGACFVNAKYPARPMRAFPKSASLFECNWNGAPPFIDLKI